MDPSSSETRKVWPLLMVRTGGPTVTSKAMLIVSSDEVLQSDDFTSIPLASWRNHWFNGPPSGSREPGRTYCSGLRASAWNLGVHSAPCSRSATTPSRNAAAAAVQTE